MSEGEGGQRTEVQKPRGGIKEQFKAFKTSFLNRLGFGRQEIEHFQDLAEVEREETAEERQQKIADRIKKSLSKKGIVATNKENLEFYEREFSFKAGYTAPEVYLTAPGGATAFDERAQTHKIYLNPHLNLFAQDYQLITLLEESIHWAQHRHSGAMESSWKNEIEAKDKILKIADFLSLSEQRRAFLRQARDVAVRQLEMEHAEQELKRELSPTPKQDLLDFAEFIKSHGEDIVKRRAAGEKLSDIIYKDFCMGGYQPKYRLEDSDFQAVSDTYYKGAITADVILGIDSEKGGPFTKERGLASMTHVDWNVHGGVPENASDKGTLGRFYLNLKAENVPGVYIKAMQAFAASEKPLHVRAKIPRGSSVPDLNLNVLNRNDQIVIYFDSAEQDEVLRIIEDLYHSYGESFINQVPRLSGRLKDSQGIVMKGVAFGQEPTPQISQYGNRSFSSIRADILESVYKDTLIRDMSPADPETALSFRNSCKANQVDPEKPAFNLDGSYAFRTIEQRIVS